MNVLLDSAHTWFFESLAHDIGGTLTARLVEGIKAADRQFVDAGDAQLGPYFPVRVEPTSRCVEIRFENVLSFFVLDESYVAEDPALNREPGRFLFVAASSSFGNFVGGTTTLRQLCTEPYQEYVVWSEDRHLHVLALSPPEVTLVRESPNLAVERTQTWSAN